VQAKCNCGRVQSQVLWIETKSEVGRQSLYQKIFQQEAEKRGETYLLVRKPEDLMGWLRERGVIPALNP
jgi:hypothetical protein